MADLKRIGTFTIDTGFNEPAWANPQSWVYEAKVNATNAVASPSQPTDTALWNTFVTATVMIGKTHYTAGSTSFPSDIGNRRIYIVCDAWVEFVRDETYFSQIDITEVEWQLVRVS